MFLFQKADMTLRALLLTATALTGFAQVATPLKSGDAEKISNSADFTSLLPMGGKLFSIPHFEDNPAGMYLSELAQDADGNLSMT